MPDWNTIAPKRAERAVHALGLLSNTARRDYDVDPAAAVAMLARIDAAVAALREAYTPRLAAGPDGPGDPAPAALSPAGAADGADPRLACPDGSELRIYRPVERAGIARFVHEIPAGHLPDWHLHLDARARGED